MKANTSTDVRKTKQAKLERFRIDLAELEKLPAAKEAEAKARDEQEAHRRSPLAINDNPEYRAQGAALNTEVIKASGVVQSIQSTVDKARQEIPRIESLLGAPAEIERLQKESNAIAAEGASIEKRVAALRGVVDAITAQRVQAAAKATTELADAAEAGVAARLDGKRPPPTKASGSANAELTSLDAELAAGQRQFAATTEALCTLTQRANDVRKQLLRARYCVAELDYLQAIENARPAVEYRAAIVRVAGMHDLVTDSALAVDELAVQGLVNELEAEYRGWQPAALSTRKTAVADAGASESVEPAQAAA
jgi:hypothetical protein